jgi:hypothetical protein
LALTRSADWGIEIVAVNLYRDATASLKVLQTMRGGSSSQPSLPSLVEARA